VRALLDRMRENETGVQKWVTVRQAILQHASSSLNILDPEAGEEELIQAVAAEAAKLRALMRSV
jgi:hypothetical protein